jgi:hypothetical protein
MNPINLIRQLDPVPADGSVDRWVESPQAQAILERILETPPSPSRPARLRPGRRFVVVAVLLLALAAVAATASAEVRGGIGGAIDRYLHVDYFGGAGVVAPPSAQKLVRQEFALDNPLMSWPKGATLGPITGMAAYGVGADRYGYYVGHVNTSQGEGYCTLLLGPDRRKLGGSCSYQPTFSTLVVTVERGIKTGVAIISGVIPPKVATVTVRFADGKRIRAASGRGWYLMIVTPAQRLPGHVPVAVVARDAAGKLLGRMSLAGCFDRHISGSACEVDNGG